MNFFTEAWKPQVRTNTQPTIDFGKQSIHEQCSWFQRPKNSGWTSSQRCEKSRLWLPPVARTLPTWVSHAFVKLQYSHWPLPHCQLCPSTFLLSSEQQRPCETWRSRWQHILAQRIDTVRRNGHFHAKLGYRRKCLWWRMWWRKIYNWNADSRRPGCKFGWVTASRACSSFLSTGSCCKIGREF